MKTTTKTGEGDRQETATSMDVTALEVTSLDAGLFEVPAGYTQVQSGAELMPGFQARGGLSRALLGSTADGTSAAAPKRAGAIRIGVLEPVDKSAHNLPTGELHQQLAAQFHDAPFEALALSGNGFAESRAQAERLQCDYVLSSEVADIKTSRPGKLGGMLKKVSGEGPTAEVHEVKLAYTLYRVGSSATAPAFADSARASSGGFDVRAALRVAASAGSLYLRFSGLGALTPLLVSGFSGGGLAPLTGAGLFDPRMTAMSSMTRLLATTGVEATTDPATTVTHGATASAVHAQADIRRTIDVALANAAKGTMEQLNKFRQ